MNICCCAGLDKTGKQRRFPPLQMGWQDDSEKQLIKMRAEDADRLGFVPAGVIIDLSEMVKEKRGSS